MSMPEPRLAPALDGAALDPEVVHAGELDAVPVALRPDVPDDQAPQDDVVGGALGGAAVVDVDAVALGPRHDQVVQLDVGGVGEVQARAAALDDRRTLGVVRPQDDGPAGLAPQPPGREAAPVGAGGQADRRPRPGLGQRRRSSSVSATARVVNSAGGIGPEARAGRGIRQAKTRARPLRRREPNCWGISTASGDLEGIRPRW